MKKNIFSWMILAAFVCLFFLPNHAWAAGAGLVPCGTGDNDACTLCDLIVGFKNLVDYLLKLLVTICIAGLFFAGVMYMVSAGNEGRMTAAKEFAKAVLIGFVTVLGAWLIISVALWAIASNFSKITPDSSGNWYTFSVDCK